jgi:Tfp pilus assembly protein PilN
VKNKSLGIYFGIEGVAIAEVEKKKLTSSVYLPFSVLEEEIATYEELNTKIKTEALLQRGLRKVKTEAVDAVIGLPERDLTFRILEMPMMRKKELCLALPLEIEKYIPFKIEDVCWDYKDRNVVREKKVSVGFLCAKKEQIEDTREVLENVSLRLAGVDSSALAGVDALFSMGKISRKTRNFVVLFYEGPEAEICIYNDHFPVFSRYTKVPTSPDGAFNTTRFVDDIRLTLEYYRREVGRAPIEKFYLVAMERDLSAFASVGDELGIPAERLAVETIFEEQRLSSLYEYKAFALAARAMGKNGTGFNLVRESGDASANDKDILNYFKSQASEGPLNTNVIGGIVFIGAVVYSVLALYFKNQIEPLVLQNSEIAQKINELKIVNKDEGALESTLSKLQQYYKHISEVAVPPKYSSELLNAMKDCVTEGLWFDEVSVGIDDASRRTSLNVDGYVYIESAQLENESLQDWVERIKRTDTVAKYKLQVRLNAMERVALGEYTVTRFQVAISGG